MRQHRLATLGAALCTAAAVGMAMPPVAAADPHQCSYLPSASRPTVMYGDSGVGVKQAQCLSNAWGGQPPKLTANGVFDSVMLKKIKWIQGCHGLRASGIIEGRTWQVLYHPALDCYNPYPA
ncbi:peptidoglycan-binding domain-containing protein [Streptomyces sp. A475]|uniref:peptidoglycan-binding domain-containing protein n=1 Tax=Streptomyces sp. A475 TaxID=3131976 RepID=UPI0030C95231